MVVDLVHLDRALDGDASQSSRSEQASKAPTHNHHSMGISLHGRPAESVSAYAPRRSSRWSPTRIAFAIAVSAGLTAPMLGKKLVSTT